MSSVTPLVVTHPHALVRDELQKILSKSSFRPTHILPALDETAENLLASAGACIWLVGVTECGTATNELVSKMVAKNPEVRAVILRFTYGKRRPAGLCGRRLWLSPPRHPEQAAYQVVGASRARQIGDASALSANGPHLAGGACAGAWRRRCFAGDKRWALPAPARHAVFQWLAGWPSRETTWSRACRAANW